MSDDRLDWDKGDGLLPAIVQDAATGEVRMLGYMNADALGVTRDKGFVTFFSRSKQRLWTKGETSGNRLKVEAIRIDCDDDTILVLATPEGPTCHLGSDSCFGDAGAPGTGFLGTLGRTVAARAAAGDGDSSYTARLLAQGLKRVAQKVGEEGVETALAGLAGDRAELASESADLLYHMTVLLEASGMGWDDVMRVLRDRHGA